MAATIAMTATTAINVLEDLKYYEESRSLARIRHMVASQFRTPTSFVGDDDTLEGLIGRYIGQPDQFSKFGGSLFATEFAVFSLDLEDGFAEDGLTLSAADKDMLAERTLTIREIARFVDGRIAAHRAAVAAAADADAEQAGYFTGIY